MTPELEAKTELVLERFAMVYRKEVERLSKCGGITEEEIGEGGTFCEIVVALVGETFKPHLPKYKKIYNNLKHF
jgi:hypothetical protein